MVVEVFRKHSESSPKVLFPHSGHRLSLFARSLSSAANLSASSLAFFCSKVTPLSWAVSAVPKNTVVTVCADVEALVPMKTPFGQFCPAALHLTANALGVKRLPVRCYHLFHGIDGTVAPGALGRRAPRHCGCPQPLSCRSESSNKSL